MQAFKGIETPPHPRTFATGQIQAPQGHSGGHTMDRNRYFTPKQYSQAHRIDYSTVRHWIRSGRISVVYDGCHPLIKKDEPIPEFKRRRKEHERYI